MNTDESESPAKYTFTSKRPNELKYDPAPSVHKFYQICHFKNPQTNKHSVRVSEIDQFGNFIKIETRKYNEQQLSKFFKTSRSNCYKIYPTFDLELIDYPNPGNILEAQSELLNNDYDNYGFAKF